MTRSGILGEGKKYITKHVISGGGGFAMSLINTYSPNSGVALSVADNWLTIRDPVTPANNYDGSLYNGLGSFNKLTFIRASIATDTNALGNIVSYAANQPRFGYSPYGNRLLLEGAATNLCLQSGAIANAAWSNTGVATTGAQGTAPDVTNALALVTASAGAGYHYTAQNITGGLAATVYSGSVFLKAGTQRYINFGEAGDAVWHTAVLDTLTGTITSTANCTASVISTHQNGIFRVGFVFTRTNAGTMSLYFGPDTSSASISGPNYTAAGTESCYAWGGQLEQSPFATSYIPTTTAAVARAAEVCTLPNTAFNLTQAIGSLYAKASFDRGSATLPSSRGILSVGNGTTAEFSSLYNLSGNVGGTVTSASTAQASLNSAFASSHGSTFKTAMAYAANDAALSVNSAAPVTGTPAALPTTTKLILGNTSDAGTGLFGGILEAAFLGVRITNAQLQKITT